MTIDEAIKRLPKLEELMAAEGRFDDATAIKLGIEALNTIKWLRQMSATYDVIKLPGETEE